MVRSFFNLRRDNLLGTLTVLTVACVFVGLCVGLILAFDKGPWANVIAPVVAFVVTLGLCWGFAFNNLQSWNFVAATGMASFVYGGASSITVTSVEYIWIPWVFLLIGFVLIFAAATRFADEFIESALRAHEGRLTGPATPPNVHRLFNHTDPHSPGTP